ncbi:hypothetical protein M885DRAFT_611808 [Pelagophyceae sp. CCMP2097]|nr:hypothetical protein M885DRAFT_611808 [Pelagophyceae sp. CCMP2097]|mmetsp:Transcript_26219/g.90111  ORF Transcript_26219/g.90111 Transcript_26219/m.90111 type:complete len:146 (-) Transcript_26219:255-692(-)
MSEALVSEKGALFEKWMRIQTGMAVVFVLFLVLEHSNLFVIGGTISCAAATGLTGYYVTRCGRKSVTVMYQLYALLCTVLCFFITYFVAMPAFKAFVERPEGRRLADHHVAATAVSMIYACVTVKATTCVNEYGEAAVPLKDKKA